jgi:hypothetical protein
MDWSLVSVLTSTVIETAETLRLDPEPVIVTVPCTDEVRPTASLGAARKASCSRTRYPACEPEATVQVPDEPPVDEAVELVLAEAVGLDLAELRLSFWGDEPAKTTK